MKIVIDTSILIDVLRGGDTGEILFNEVEKDNPEILIPTIVIFELFSGQSSNDPTIQPKIKNLIRNFTRIEFTEESAIIAGELYRQYGKDIGVSDCIIAASGLALNATVASLNKKNFELIPNLKLFPL